ncbi:MAG TPA: acyltransferase [Terracidiphilus sp.]|jgi:peptidoglycan/LPS O-acetylase OafA/YrhL
MADTDATGLPDAHFQQSFHPFNNSNVGLTFSADRYTSLFWWVPMRSKSPEYLTLQAGRGLAALSVMLLHIENTLGTNKHSATLYPGYQVLQIFRPGYSGVEFFFVLSGFVIFLAHRQKLGDVNQILPFVIKRLRRIYPIFWATMMVMIPFNYLFMHRRFQLTRLPAAILILPIPTSFSGGPQEAWLPVEWTLRHEILFYLLFLLVIWRPKVGIPVLSAWSLASVCDIWNVYPTGWSEFLLSRFHLLFGLGVLTAWLSTRRIRLPRTLLCCGGSLFLATWITFLCIPKWPLRYFEMLFGLGAWLMIAGAVRMEQIRPVRVPEFLLLLGNASYAIYLIHYPLVAIGVNGIIRVFPDTVFRNLTCFALTAVVSALGGIAFHLYVEKRLIALCGQWTSHFVRALPQRDLHSIARV